MDVPTDAGPHQAHTDLMTRLQETHTHLRCTLAQCHDRPPRPTQQKHNDTVPELSQTHDHTHTHTSDPPSSDVLNSYILILGLMSVVKVLYCFVATVHVIYMVLLLVWWFGVSPVV